MDVVYVLKRSDRNEELRFSLRSLANLPHDKVWAAGYRPRWANLDEIPVRQRLNKFENSAANLRAACHDPRVSDDFAYFNDDFFVLQPLEQLPVLHRGTVRDFVAEHVRHYGRPGAYLKGLQATAELLATQVRIRDPLCFEGHVPLIVNKALMRRALDLGADLPVLHYRTLYGNLARLAGEKIGDWKIRDSHSVPEPSWLFTSTVDTVFASGAVGTWLRARFPDPSPYERT